MRIRTSNAERKQAAPSQGNKGSLVGSVHDATICRAGESHEESAPLSRACKCPMKINGKS